MVAPTGHPTTRRRPVPAAPRPSALAAPQPNLQELLGNISAPSAQELYNDAVDQVSGPYDAALANLSAQERDTRGRQKRGDSQLAAMYGALQNSIKGDAKQIGGNYNAAYGGVKRNTAAGVNSINKVYSDTNRELAGLFRSLGIGAAFGDAVAGSNKDRGLLAGLLQSQGTGSMNAITSDKSAALQYNGAMAQNAGLAGKNRRADLLEQLNSALSNIGQQRNTVQGQLAGAISQRQYQLEQDAMSRQAQLQNMLVEAQTEQMNAQAKLAKAQQGSQAPGLTPAQEYSQMGPDERGYYKASQLFGNNAAYAMQLVSGVANNQNGGVYENIGHFVRSILAENQKQAAHGQPALSNAQLQALASYYWDQGGTGRRQPQQQY